MPLRVPILSRRRRPFLVHGSALLLGSLVAGWCEANTPPAFGQFSALTFTEGVFHSVVIPATDPDVPPQTLHFELEGAVAAGATLDPLTGTFTWTPAESQGPGLYSFTVKVSDSFVPPASATLKFDVQVLEANQPPHLPPPPDQATDEERELSLELVATDPDLPPNPLRFGLLPGAPYGCTLDPITGRFAWTPTEAQGPSTNVIAYTVTDADAGGIIVTNTFRVIVNETNRQPLLSPVEVFPMSEGWEVYLGLEAADPDLPANTLRFSLAPGTPPWIEMLDPAAGFIRIHPGESQGGTTTYVTVQVFDDGSPALSDSVEFPISVAEANSAPQLTGAVDRTVLEGDPVTFLAGIDPDQPTNHLSFRLVGSVPPGAVLDPLSGEFHWTPDELAGPSTNVITLEVEDDGSPPATDRRAFTITVLERNEPPTLAAIPDQVVNEGDLLSFPLLASDPDIPANALTFQLDPGAPEGAVLDTANTRFSWTPTESAGPGVYPITIRVTDHGLPPLEVTRSFQVEVREVNSPPVLSAPAAIEINEGTVLSLGAIDPDQPVNRLYYEVISPPRLIRLEWTANPDTNVAGYHVYHRTESQPGWNLLGSVPDRLATGFDCPPLTPGIAHHFELAAYDVSGVEGPRSTTLSFAAPLLDREHGTVEWIPADLFGGTTQAFAVRLTDDGDPPQSVEKAFEVTFRDTNSTPRLPALPDRIASEGDLMEFPVTAADHDLPPDTLTYSLEPGAPPWASLDPHTGLLRMTLGEELGGTYHVIGVRVTDNGSPPLSDVRFFALQVLDVNTPPTLPTLPPMELAEGERWSFHLTAGDVDLPANLLSYELEPPVPPGLTLDPATGVLSWTPSEEQGPGEYRVVAVVRDDGIPEQTTTAELVLQVWEVNAPPVLVGPPDTETYPLVPLVLRSVATDPDLPENSLTYVLERGPSGAEIDPATGTFTWRPTQDQADQTFPIKIVVLDDGLPGLSAKSNFNIRVLPLPDLALQLIQPADGTLSLQFKGIPGASYSIQTSADLVHWVEIRKVTGSIENVQVPLPPTTPDQGFYRVTGE